MSGSRFVAFGLVFTMLTALPAGAQTPGSVPRVVRFDGQAAAGAATGARTAVLAVFDAATDGAPLWQETQVVQVGPDGRFAVLVGAGQAEGLPPAVLASREPRWLEVRFDGEPAMTRALLTSVPYALRAADADTLGGLPASAFLRAPERAGADRGGAPDASASGDLDRPTVNTGTTGYIGKFTNSIDLTSSVMFESAGRIGLGVTTTPLDFMHVRFADGGGTLTGYAVQNTSAAAAAYSGMLFYDHTGALRQFQGYNNSTGEYRINNIAPSGSINFMLASTSRFTVTPAGIGIDTASPLDPLHVQTGFIRSGTGLRMGGTIMGGVSQELNGGIVNLGTNDSRTGTFQVGTKGGFFRVDTRFNQPLFQWWGKETTAGGETRLMYLDNVGTLTVPAVRTTSLVSSPLSVMVDVDGQLGIVSSSRRYKEDIRDMGETSTGLMALRPVTYRYREGVGGATGARPVEYGLIAEEVAAVYPDLVARLAGGEIETVQYHKVNAMLLNEVQKQHRRLAAQDEALAAQQRTLDAQARQLEALQRRLAEFERLRVTAAPSTRQR